MFKNTPAFSGISVTDLDEALDFYQNTLGVTVEVQEGMGFRLKLQGTTIFVYSKGADHKPASFTVLNFVVDDIDKAVAELKAKGVTFEIYDAMMHQDEQGIARGKQANMGPDIAWFKDPAGNTLAVLQD